VADSETRSILTPGGTCWKIAQADRARVLIDADEYFSILRAAMLKAERRILMIGWDFDTRITLGRGKRKRGDPPAQLGAFILWLANNRPALEIKILKWNIGALKMLARGSTLVTAARWAMHDRIQLKFDAAHPVGCSHHQKIVVIDDSFAVCGGIDMTSDRWDTREHRPHDPRRKQPSGKLYTPWHDVTMITDGDIAKSLGELGRDRWQLGTGEALAAVEANTDPWPEDVEPHFRDVEIGIARTRATWEEVPEIREIEALFLAQIAAAQNFVYIENQYFTSRKIAEAIAKRLEEPDPPEFVMVNPVQADGWLEQKAMDGARAQLLRSLGEKPGSDRLCVYSPVNEAEEDIYVHAKLMIVDDRLIRIGSANMNNRSLGLDSECDLTIDSGEPGNAYASDTIRSLRMSLIAEHCGASEAEVAAALADGGSMIAFINNRPQTGRRLVRLDLPELTDAEKFIAENEILDPDSPDAMLDPIAKRGLFRKRLLKQPE
jgi:phosphatidylserine/phosphatidylglycerophosphate/cardiolipin synthase-like enzyme